MFRAASFLLSFQTGSDEFDTVCGEAGLELAAGVALVGDHGLYAATGEQGRVVIEHVDRDVAFCEQIADRRNIRKIAKVAIARRIITLTYYGLRDGNIRCLEPAA